MEERGPRVAAQEDIHGNLVGVSRRPPAEWCVHRILNTPASLYPLLAGSSQTCSAPVEREKIGRSRIPSKRG